MEQMVEVALDSRPLVQTGTRDSWSVMHAHLHPSGSLSERLGGLGLPLLPAEPVCPSQLTRHHGEAPTGMGLKKEPLTLSNGPHVVPCSMSGTTVTAGFVIQQTDSHQRNNC